MLAYLYRLIAIPLATLLLVVMALFYGTILIPIRIYVFRKTSIDGIRHQVSRGIRTYLKCLNTFKLLKLETVNYETAKDLEPVILIANHPSIFDILFLLSLFPTASCIAKKSLKGFSPYSLVVRWCNYITTKKDSNILEEAFIEIQSGHSVIIFPEGTRSSKDFQLQESQKYKFHRGAANLHILSGTRLLPVTISCTPPALAKGQLWHEVPKKLCHARMVFHIDFKLKNNHKHQYRTISSRTITKELEEFYENMPKD